MRITSTSKPAVAMQAIADAARHHPYYVQAAPLSHAELSRVIGKMMDRYPDLTMNKYAACRLKKAGKPVHRIILLLPRHKILTPGLRTTGGFWMLATAPDPSEKWQLLTDRDNRLTLYWWQLVRHTRAGQATPAWTWRMKPDVKERLKEQIIEAIDKHWDGWLEHFIARSRRWPGFAGIRQDHRDLMRLIRGRWQRVRRGLLPWKLPRLPYLQRISHRETYIIEDGGG